MRRKFVFLIFHAAITESLLRVKLSSLTLGLQTVRLPPLPSVKPRQALQLSLSSLPSDHQYQIPS